MKEKTLTQMNIAELREQCRDRTLAAEETATRDDLIQRIVLYDAGMKNADLPPSGYARDEELARRKDTLEEKLETEAPEVYPIDESAFQPDREILQRLDQQMLEVSKRKPEYIYCWVYFGQNGQQVWAKKALGWEVVTGTEPEATEHKEVDGTRRIGDVLLMRVHKRRFAQLEEAAADRREAQQLGITSRLKELGEHARRYGLKVHEDLSTVRVGPDTLMDVVEKRSGAHDTAMKTVDKMLRKGDVPGVPSPGGDA